MNVSSYGDDNVGGEFGFGSGPYDTGNSSIVDSGCSQGCSGGNMRHVAWTDDRVVVQGYGDDIPRHGYRIGTFAMVARNTHGQYIMLVFHQYAGREDMRSSNMQTLHSTLQLRHNRNLTLDDTPIAQGGQQVVMIGEHSFNLHFDNGRVIWPGRPFTDEEWISLPRVVVTDPIRWNPNQYNDNNLHHDALSINEYPRARSRINRHYTPYGINNNYLQDRAIGIVSDIWRTSYDEEFNRLRRIGMVNGETDDDSDDTDSLPSLDSYGMTGDNSDGDNINTANSEITDENGEDLLMADRMAHRINMLLLQNELAGIIDSISERDTARGILQQLGTVRIPRRHEAVMTDTVFADSPGTATHEESNVESSSDSDTHEEVDVNINYTVRHSDRIKARAVYVER